MGLISIQIFSDTPFVPYAKLLLHSENPMVCAYSLLYIDKQENLVNETKLIDIESKERRILELRESLFPLKV
jgi:hypothetical protein